MSSSPKLQTELGDSITTALSAHPQWYAIRTRSRHEKMVAEQLQRQEIESFLPLVKRTRKWSDRTKEVELPLFSGYNFVRVALTSPDRLRVLQTHGVAGFVGINGCGTAIPDGQIEDIRTLLASKVPFQEQPFLRVGQRVRIRGGSLDGVEGILSAQNEDRSLVISLEPIQRSLSVRIQGYAVEPV
ncbi:MAG: UpxY family transcription antiterminator [Acidobacteriia bacterium]|nr:UpxY family transcription antiterminator [Terriglobia bacterium]